MVESTVLLNLAVEIGYRLQESGALVAFTFEGKRFPAESGTAFYNWLYIKALEENPELAGIALQYHGFTDIEFNPSKGRACQAMAAAMYVSLKKQGLVEEFLAKPY